MRIQISSSATSNITGNGRSAERGQLLPLTALAVVMAGLTVIALAKVGHAASARAQAQTSADAAALAGAANGRQAAEVVASANGAAIVEYRQIDGTVSVKVKLDRASAKAKARVEASDDLPTSLQAIVSRAEQLAGGRIAINPGSVEQGSEGLSFSVAQGDAQRLATVASEVGLCPLGSNRFRICPFSRS